MRTHFQVLLLLLGEFAKLCLSIKVIESNVKIGPNLAKSMTWSGARLIPDQGNVSIKDVTFCVRFNFKVLRPSSRNRIISIEKGYNGIEVRTTE